MGLTAKKKILVCAYACSPVQGSEPGMGWSFVTELAKKYDVWVITEEEKFRADIESQLRDKPSAANSVRFHYVRKVRARHLRKLWPPSYYWFYRHWHKKAYKLARQLHDEVGFDIVHQLNMVGFREPGYMWKLPLPFVWGPVGGMMQLPWKYFGMLGWHGMLFYGGRNLINAIQQRYCRRCRLAGVKAGSGLMAATSEMREKMRKFWGCESVLLSEIGREDSEKISVGFSRDAGEPLRIAWSGVHVPRKGLPLLLAALGEVERKELFKLDVLGSGSESAKWRSFADSKQLTSIVEWHGWVDRADSVEVIRRSHVLVITSLLDLTSTVTLEALSMGVPVICLDHCGMGEVVTDRCGIKLPVSNPTQTILDLSCALMTLHADEALRQRLSEGAVERAAQFSWPIKSGVLEKVYSSVVQDFESRKRG